MTDMFDNIAVDLREDDKFAKSVYCDPQSFTLTRVKNSYFSQRLF